VDKLKGLKMRKAVIIHDENKWRYQLLIMESNSIDSIGFKIISGEEVFVRVDDLIEAIRNLNEQT
jgi:hypothetical protein